MTRETKIGLLVGLAFIIVIGILLSDHLSSTNEPLGAPLRVAGDSLRSGLGQPGSDDVAPMLKAPAIVAPSQPVVINDELKHQTVQPPVHFVNPPVNNINNNGGGGAITPNPVANNRGGNDNLRQVAQQHGEDIVPVDPNNNQANNTSVHVDPVVPQAPKPTARTYVAQSGDSLGSIAMKAYGSGNKANREAIVTANPGLAANRDLIVAGRTYVIPTLGNTPAAPTPTQASAQEKPTAAASLTYTVKPHDTLWSIAMNEVGNPSAVAAIKELNQDVLNGSERLRPNMKLTLPAKKTVE